MGEGNATDDGVTGPQREVAAALAQAQADLASAQALSRQLSETAIAGLAARTQIESEQAVVATKSAHIQQAQEHADGVRANLDRALTAATGSATEAEGLRARAQTAADATTEIATAAGAKKATIEADAVASLAAKEAAEKTALALKALHTRAESAEAKVVAYEARLQELVDVAADQLARITELLPAAASAGLATAFDKRRMSFLKPSWGWQALFVASVGVLALLAYGGLNQATGLKDQSFDGLWRLWAARLPIAVALVWLALHSGREAALAQRLEEDYGYKAAVAASFVGFNAQMKQIDEQVRPDSPLAKLCADTLGTIASPPGRIYDKHQLTHTPADQLKALIESAIDRARANVSPQSK